jgi:hypothetical protein
MLIISAGVIMNILFGMLCFVAVYRYHGVDRSPAMAWRTEAGSPALGERRAGRLAGDANRRTQESVF